MAETTAHTEAPAGHAKFPPFESEHFPSQLVWLVISLNLKHLDRSLGGEPQGPQSTWEKVIRTLSDWI